MSSIHLGCPTSLYSSSTHCAPCIRRLWCARQMTGRLCWKDQRTTLQQQEASSTTHVRVSYPRCICLDVSRSPDSLQPRIVDFSPAFLHPRIGVKDHWKATSSPGDPFRSQRTNVQSRSCTSYPLIWVRSGSVGACMDRKFRVARLSWKTDHTLERQGISLRITSLSTTEQCLATYPSSASISTPARPVKAIRPLAYRVPHI
ncbi:hypothetical protein C8F01DRAFT_369992 [Mycena amicta]|nr:hypothetical protein C8F01DRAFT_369992 [Mycena amicta]